jgi:plasmid rolling circle replication initiator protein Rep
MLKTDCRPIAATEQAQPAPTGGYLTDYSPSDKPWDVHRAQAQTVEGVYAHTAYDALAGRIRGCSGFLGFGWLSDPDTGEIRLKLREARFCRVRYCPVCQWRRSLMHKARFHQALPEILARHPQARWVFLTLTVLNCPITELRATLSAMAAGWKRLIQRKDWPALGWIRSTEVTRGRDGSAHPHFHCLLLVPPSYFSGKGYVKQAAWQERWMQACRLDYAPVVDVRAVKGEAAAAAEALKYSTKPSDLASDPQWLEELTKQTHKLRFLATGGVLKDTLRELERDESELLNPGEGDASSGGHVDLRFSWQRAERRYRRD